MASTDAATPRAADDPQRALERALKARDGRAVLKAGESLWRVGDYTSAIQAFETASQLGQPRAWRELGRTFEKLGDRDAAREAYEKGGLVGDVIALRLLAHLLVGENRPDDAVRIFDEASRRGDLVSRRLLARLEADRGNDDDAIRLWLSAADGGDLVSRRMLGQHLRASGNTDGAITQLRLAGNAGDAIALRMLGDLYVSLGRPAEARAALGAAARRRDRTASARPAAIERGTLPDPTAGPTEEPAADDPAAPDSTWTAAARVVSDLPSRTDLLGVRPLVDGLTLLLRDRRTELPIAIAITGPWGAGKSSVMLQLREALDLAPARDADARRWSTVRFDGWKYERRERLWAALATAIYEQPQRKMTRWERLKFRVRLEWRRRGPLGFLGSFAWPLPVAAAGGATALATGLGVIGVASLAPLLTTVVRFSGAIADPFKRAMQRSSRTPDYEGALGFTQQTEHDVGCLVSTLNDVSDTAVAVFVDDLDRCSSQHVVEVVETMNQIFNSSANRRCLFVLGMDREVVAAAIEVEYADIIARLERANSSLAEGYGMSFLAKLVQLSVAVPPPRPDAMRRLLAHIVRPQDPLTGGLSSAEEASLKQQASVYAPESLEEVSDLGDELRSEGTYEPAAVDWIERELRSQLIRRDARDVVIAETAAVAWLEPNPRQLKRFDNAFRLQLYVANAAAEHLRFSEDELVALARWVALRLRWPHLAEDLDDEPALLPALDAHANGEGEPSPELLGRFGRWFEDRTLRATLADAEVKRRISHLPLDAFLHVA